MQNIRLLSGGAACPSCIIGRKSLGHADETVVSCRWNYCGKGMKLYFYGLSAFVRLSSGNISDQMIHRHVFPKWGGVERLFDLIV